MSENDRSLRPAEPSYRKVAEILAWTRGYFEKLGLSTPRLDAELLLAAAMGLKRIDLYTGYERWVEAEERARFRELIQRRARREPVAYILGEKEFYSLPLKVTPAVLIPRPETEHVVDACLELLRTESVEEAPRVLDLGTGSGNIAVALAVHEPRIRVDAVDISEEALEIARENADRHGVTERVRLLRGDLFGPLGPGSPVYRIIISTDRDSPWPEDRP